MSGSLRSPVHPLSLREQTADQVAQWLCQHLRRGANLWPRSLLQRPLMQAQVRSWSTVVMRFMPLRR